MDLYLFRTITFWTFVGLGVLSLAYPWKVSGRVSKITLHSPILMAGVFAIHEWSMPAGLDSRVDLLAIVTLSGPVFGAYCFRLCLFGGRGERVGVSHRRLKDLSWSERTSLLPFNHDADAEQVARLRR